MSDDSKVSKPKPEEIGYRSELSGKAGAVGLTVRRELDG